MSELRHDPVSRRWVIIATERAHPPGDFEFEPPVPEDDEVPCVFCPGREYETPPELFAVRDQGTANGPGWHVRVIPNKRPVLAIEGEPDRRAIGIFDRMRGIGAHELVIETPEHRRRPSQVPLLQFAAALQASRTRLADLARDQRFKYLLLYKNYGAAVGATIHHPLQQIVATPVVPTALASKLEAARGHFTLKERCLFCDVVSQEIESGARVVLLDDHFVTLSAYAARVPFELTVYPRRHAHQFTDLDQPATERLAAHMLEVFRRLEVVLGNPPLHWFLANAPNAAAAAAHGGPFVTLPWDWHWHIEILPRLAPTTGFEWGTGYHINPFPPESAAAFLRDAG